jgi:hypothetical protein
VAVSDAPHYLEIAWQAASAAGANDGVLAFWLDDTQQDSYTNIDNDTRLMDYVALGAVAGVDNGSRGTMYFDEFEARRDSYIDNHFEWTGSTSTMEKYYYADATRIGMRIGTGTGSAGLTFLFGDHPSQSLRAGLGSNSMNANSAGIKTSEIRFKAWG